MVRTTGARGQDARALTIAILLGVGAGGLTGGAYLIGAPARHAAPVAAQPPGLVAMAGAASPAAAPLPPVAATPLTPAAPFRFAAVARGTSDLQCLTEAVYFEARGEPKTGQQAVAQVVLNRVRHPAFPKSVCAVVHQRTEAGCQFSYACERRSGTRDTVAWSEAQTVARGALHGAVMRQVGDATHFESVRAVAFAGLLKVARIGEHVFYRFGGHDGAPAMFHQTPRPSATAETAAAPRLIVASLTLAPSPLVRPAPVDVKAAPPPPRIVQPPAATAAPTAPQAAPVVTAAVAARPAAPPVAPKPTVDAKPAPVVQTMAQS